MKTVRLATVEIDSKGRMRLYPVEAAYDFIYRAAAGVDWDKEGRFLHARELGDWTYPEYFGQIVSAVASEYGDVLKTESGTKWIGVSDIIRQEIETTE